MTSDGMLRSGSLKPSAFPFGRSGTYRRVILMDHDFQTTFEAQSHTLPTCSAPLTTVSSGRKALLLGWWLTFAHVRICTSWMTTTDFIEAANLESSARQVAHVAAGVLFVLPSLLILIALAFFMIRAAPGGPFDSERNLPVICCNVEGFESPQTGEILDVEHDIATRIGLHCAPLAHEDDPERAVRAGLEILEGKNLPGIAAWQARGDVALAVYVATENRADLPLELGHGESALGHLDGAPGQLGLAVGLDDLEADLLPLVEGGRGGGGAQGTLSLGGGADHGGPVRPTQPQIAQCRVKRASHSGAVDAL